MKHKFIPSLVLVMVLIIFFAAKVFADSAYVLPYPSSMPGSRFYKAHLVWEYLVKYWYFGDFGQFKYNLTQSDKYLVEAKTLFEYKQHLLADKALKKSDNYFKNILPNLIKAKNKNKNITQKQNLLKEASLKHIEALTKIELETPKIFIWRPEKSSQTILNIEKLIEESISIRKKYL